MIAEDRCRYSSTDLPQQQAFHDPASFPVFQHRK